MTMFQLPPSYPDELWYSRLARYHRRSGNLRICTTMRELGTNLLNSNHKVSLFNSCSAMLNFYTVRQDEESYWKVIAENTLDPFSLRFYTVEKRQEYYASLHNSHRKTIMLLHPMEKGPSSLRYCPICYQEDMEMYGESYWHRIHQIPAVTICPKHQCQILYAQVPITAQSTSKLYCADAYTCPDMSVIPMQNPEQLGPIHYMQQMLEYPYDVQKEEPVDGLKEILLDNQYMLINKNGGFEFRKQDILRQDIINKYGNYAKRIFTDGGKRIQLFRICCSRTMFTTERFAILMDFFGIPFHEAIQQKEDLLHNTKQIKKLYQIADSGYLWNKSKAAERLGIKSEQLQRLADALDIPRFWGPDLSGEQEQHTSIKIPMTTLKFINERVKELGIYNIETYILYAAQKEAEINARNT